MELSVCVEMFWPELSLPERLRRVKELGFTAFEFWTWRDKELDALRAVQAETGLICAGMVAEPHFALVRRDNVDEQVRGVAESAAVAHSLGCSTLIVTAGDTPTGESYEMTRRHVVRKLRSMATVAADQGVVLCLEPLNPVVDHPHQWLTTVAQTLDLVAEVDSPALRILFDIYHQQVTEGNLTAQLQRSMPLIRHIHAAGVPGRNELVGGELDYRSLFGAIRAAGYGGYVGLEFRPTLPAEEALRQAISLLPS